jgi:hypothetical protein
MVPAAHLSLHESSFFSELVDAWEWSDVTDVHVGGQRFLSLLHGSSVNQPTSSESWMSILEISSLRVRDIKRRLTRRHGYSPDRISNILDKKELIHMLAYEEDKIRMKYEQRVQQDAFFYAVLVAVLILIITIGWPIIEHAYNVISVNLVVYTDRKIFEAKQCMQLQSTLGMAGLGLMILLDLLQLWLSLTVAMSWVIAKNKFFFPYPSFSLSLQELVPHTLGSNQSQAPVRPTMDRLGINFGPMIVGMLLDFSRRRLEAWIGRVLLAAKRKHSPMTSSQLTEQKVAEVAFRTAKRASKEAKVAVAIAAALADEARQINQLKDGEEEAIPSQSESDACTLKLDNSNDLNEALLQDIIEMHVESELDDLN